MNLSVRWMQNVRVRTNRQDKCIRDCQSWYVKWKRHLAVVFLNHNLKYYEQSFLSSTIFWAFLLVTMDVLDTAMFLCHHRKWLLLTSWFFISPCEVKILQNQGRVMSFTIFFIILNCDLLSFINSLYNSKAGTEQFSKNVVIFWTTFAPKHSNSKSHHICSQHRNLKFL